MSDLKPLIVRFVEAGLAALDTPEMTQTIIRAFQTDGRFAIMRSPDIQQQMKLSLTIDVLEGLNIFVPEEFEQGQNDDEPAVSLLSRDVNSDDVVF